MKTPGALADAARTFLDNIGERRIFAFRAPMGAGKTTFIAEVCRLLGVDDVANSPSFSIINEYVASDGNKVYHFDFYRLDSAEQALDIGVEDYLYSGALCLMEWPERIEALLPDETVEVTITVHADESRTIKADI